MIYTVSNKKTLIIGFLGTIFTLNFVCGFTFAQESFSIIDEASSGGKVESDVEKVGSGGGSVWDNYNAIAESMDTEADLGNQLASGIMTWDTLLRYAVKLVRRLSQIGLLAGATMVLYAGYLYATEVFMSKSGEGNKAIKNAIIGVLVISFSYAIMKLITSAFL